MEKAKNGVAVLADILPQIPLLLGNFDLKSSYLWPNIKKEELKIENCAWIMEILNGGLRSQK